MKTIVEIAVLVVITTFFTTPYASVYGQSGKEQELKDEINKLKKNLRSTITREAVEKAYSQLLSPHRSERNEALHFFGDMKAKSVLHSIMSTRAQTERIGFAQTDLRFLAEVFQTGDDVLSVCEALLENAEGVYLESGGTEGVMARRRFLTETGKLLAQLAGVEFIPFKKFDQQSLKIWVVATLREGWEKAESEEQKEMLQPSLKSLDPDGNYEIERTRPPEKEPSAGQTTSRVSMQKSSDTLVIVLSIAVVVLAGVVVFLLIHRKKRG